MTFSKCFMASVMLAFSISVSAQTPAPTRSVDSAMAGLSRNFPIEKLYVQTDKSHYLPEDSLWFKAYSMTNGMPSPISSNLLVDFANSTGKVIRQTVWPIVESSAAGSISLKGLKPGSYQFRAYTPWMMNSDTAFFFYKTIQIIETESTVKPNLNYDYSVQFLPEGGNWVSDVVNNMAFIARGNDGKPADLKGRVLDAQGEVLTEFNSVHDGMGNFLMVPITGQVYTAEIDVNGMKKTFTLQESSPTAVSLRVQQSGEQIMFQLQSGQSFSSAAGPITLVAYMDQQLIYKAITQPDKLKEGISGKIALQDLPPGVVTLTVLEGNWKPLAERIYFVPSKGKEVIKPELSRDTFNVAVRSLNVWEVKLPNAGKGNYSVSITDADRVPGPGAEDNIVSRFLLSGELMGRVYQPGWYLDRPYDSVKKAIDLLMLTQGWRKYNWELLSRNIYPRIAVRPEPLLQLKGDVYNAAGRKPLGNQELLLILMASDSSRQLLTVNTDAGGSFKMGGLVFFDTIQVYYQLNKSKGDSKDVSVRLNNSVISTLTPLRPLTFPYNFIVTDTAMRNLARNSKSVFDKFYNDKNTLAEVFVKARKKTPKQLVEERYVSGLFASDNGTTFDLINEPAMGSMDIFQFLQGRVAGLMVNNTGGGYQLSYRGGSPALFLDEMPVDASFLQTMSVDNIALVKVLRPPFIGASGGGANGAIAIYSKKGAEQRAAIPGLEKTKLGGYTVMKQFYSPDYKEQPEANPFGDFRSTLLWVPFAFTSAKEPNVPIRFFNNDQTKRFRIVMEGVDNEGRLIRLEKVVE